LATGGSICVLLALGCGTVAKTLVMNNPKVEKILTEPKPDRVVTHTGRVEYIGNDDDRITVLYVTGTPYEMGYEHGLLLTAQVRGTIQDVEAGADKFLPKELRDSNLISPRDKQVIIDDILDRAVQLLEDARVIEGLSETGFARLAS